MDYNISTEFEVFLDRLIDEAHGDISLELRAAMKKDLYGRLQNHLMTSFVQALPAEKEEAFVEFMNGTPDETAIQEFFAQNIPNLNEVVAESLMEFRDVYIGAAA